MNYYSNKADNRHFKPTLINIPHQTGNDVHYSQATVFKCFELFTREKYRIYRRDQLSFNIYLNYCFGLFVHLSPIEN